MAFAQKPPFVGAAKPLVRGDIAAAASALGVGIAHIQAICEVETGDQGAFDSLGRPTILYERHIFRDLTGGKFDAIAPDLSNRAPGGYGKYSSQYPKLLRAVELDRDAALRACSWGRFQVLGRHCRLCGWADVETFVADMMDSEKAHLTACVGFISAMRLDGRLRRCDWAGFARGYNGPNYAQNHYDAKLADAFKKAGGQ